MFRRPFAAAMLFLGAACLPVIANASTGFVDGSTELHAGPDYDYPTVAVIDDDARVEVYGCLEDWSWCDVSFYDDRGWIAGDHLASIYEGRRQPIAYVAPYIGLGILAFSFDTYWDRHYHGRPWYRERAHWEDYSSHHFRPSWEGRRAGWDHGNHDRGNWGGRDNDHRDNNWRDNVRRDDDRRQEAQRQQAQRQDFERRQQEANRGRQDDMMRGWREQRQREQQHQQAANPSGRVDNAAVERQERAFQQHGGGGGRDWGRGMAADAGRQQQNFQRPQPQPQAQPQQHQDGGDRGGHGGDHGGGRGGEHGGGHGDHDRGHD